MVEIISLTDYLWIIMFSGDMSMADKKKVNKDEEKPAHVEIDSKSIRNEKYGNDGTPWRNSIFSCDADVKCPFCECIFHVNLGSKTWSGPGMGLTDLWMRVSNEKRKIGSGGYKVTIRCSSCRKLFNVYHPDSKW
jgi:hypothetical protein